MQTEFHELDVRELDQVSGGMRWTPGTGNADVIDARGGQVNFWFLKCTLDVNGRVSSIYGMSIP